MASPLTLAWYACDLRTGYVAEELRSLSADQGIGRRMGALSASTLTLDLAGAPDEWEAATDDGRTLQVACDSATNTPLWAGITLVRDGGSDPTLQLAAVTPETYLDRRYPGDYTATATDLSTVMAALATPALTSGPPLSLDVTASGTTINYTMADTEDRTILSGLQELAAMDGAPEWTIDPVWADAAQTRISLVLRIRPTLGVVTTSPNAIFDMPGCISSYRLTESYERGKGATETVARGEQTAAGRATSGTQTATALIAAGWCLWQHRWSPASGITDTAQLDRHATEALALMGTGSRAWTVQAVASQAPRLGVDWSLGDSIGVEVASSPRHPAGISTVARAYGWSLDPHTDRVVPILLEDS